MLRWPGDYWKVMERLGKREREEVVDKVSKLRNLEIKQEKVRGRRGIKQTLIKTVEMYGRVVRT
jgi:hypothetical protein